VVQLERVSQHALLSGFAAADALRRRLTDGMATRSVDGLVEDAAIPDMSSVPLRLCVGVHETLHALQRVQGSGVFSSAAASGVKAKCGTVIGARRNLAKPHTSALGERSGCDVLRNGVPRE
jgi:hypothetical protein